MNTRMPRSSRFRTHDAHLARGAAGGAVCAAGNVVVRRAINSTTSGRTVFNAAKKRFARVDRLLAADP